MFATHMAQTAAATCINRTRGKSISPRMLGRPPPVENEISSLLTDGIEKQKFWIMAAMQSLARVGNFILA